MRTKTPEQADKILAAAARLFAMHRFHEARMEDIAAAAEVGKGTLYRYFKDKDELYEALLEQAAQEITTRLEEEVGGASSPREQLEAILRAVMTYFDEHPHLFDLIQHAEATSRLGSASPWQKARDAYVRLMHQAFEAGKTSGDFVIADPDLALHMLGGGLRSVIRFTPQPRPDDLIRHMVDTFLHGAARPCRTAHNGHRTAGTN